MEYLKNTKYEVLTESGFKPFDGLKKTKQKALKFWFSDKTDLTCTYNHRIKTQNGFVYAKNLRKNDNIFDLKIVKIRKLTLEKDVYDLINVKDTHSYITNSVISHNCAHIDQFYAFYQSVYPTISSGKSTKIIMSSTPNGLNHYYEFWKNAEKGINGFHPIKITWERVPTFKNNPKWKEETLASLNFDNQKFQQEYEVAWLGSSGTLISGWKLEQLTHDILTPMISMDSYNQYEKPIPKRKYITIADVARGKGLDYSACSIIDITETPFKQVFTYRNNMVTPLDYAEMLYRVSMSYNQAHILVEINDIGQQVVDSIFNEFDYENIIYTESKGRIGKIAGTYLGKSSERGVRTTKIVKSVGCTILKMLLEQDKLIIPDKDTVQELSTFSRKNDTYQAEPGKHDDMVMGLVLFAWLSDQQLFRDINEISTLMMLKQKSTEEYENEMANFFIDSGEDIDDIIPKSHIGGNWLFKSDEMSPEFEAKLRTYPDFFGSQYGSSKVPKK